MIERKTIAYIALAFALVWIFFIDVRPFAERWWKKRRHSPIFTVLEDIHCQTHSIKSGLDENNTEFYQNVFYLAAGNNLETGQTLKRVQARIFHHGPPTLCHIKDSASGEIDIRHGEWVFFEIGKLVSKEIMGPFYGSIVVEEDRMKAYNHNVPRGFLSFEIESVGKKREYGLGHRPELPNVWSVFMVISADDVKAAQVSISIDMTKTQSSVSCELIA